jgi:hypothetical protein
MLVLLTNAVSPGRNQNPKRGSVNFSGVLMEKGRGGERWPGLKALLPAADKRISKHAEEFLCGCAVKEPPFVKTTFSSCEQINSPPHEYTVWMRVSIVVFRSQN